MIPQCPADGHGRTTGSAAIDERGLAVNDSGIKVGVLSDSFNNLGGAADAEVTDLNRQKRPANERGTRAGRVVARNRARSDY